MTAARILAVGDNVVDCYPDLGVMFPGGNAVNVAVHAKRCGAQSAYLGALGTDAAGLLLAAALKREAVDLALTRVVDGPNAYAVVRVVAGNRRFEAADVGVSRFTLSADDFSAMRAVDIVHTGECSLVEAQLSKIADSARLLSFDFSERPWDYVEAYARYADVAIVSAPNSGDSPAALAARVAALGPSTVAVTQGASGATLFVNGRTLYAPAGRGEVVDTLGAGDAFIARLLVGLAAQEPPESLLPAATKYATQTCASYGAFGYETPLPEQKPLSSRMAAPQ
jgi:sugar/nucleoside kinase (ribokinase family)